MRKSGGPFIILSVITVEETGMASEHDDSAVITEAGGDGVYYALHNMNNDGLDVTITQAIAEITDVEPANLEFAFSKAVDPDALNRLFRPDEHAALRKNGKVVFTIHGFTVTVFSHGVIKIESVDEAPADSVIDSQ